MDFASTTEFAQDVFLDDGDDNEEDDEDHPTPLPSGDHTNVLTIKTVQISPFRTLITALKDILLSVETNITFQPDGMRIINMDKSHTILVYVHLPAENFEFYECLHHKIIIGVNMVNFFKLINMMENNETLTIFIDNSDYVDGIVHHLSVRFENNAIKQCRTFRMFLADPDMEEIVFPDVTFSSIINFPSEDFQKIIRDFGNISNKLVIQSVGSQLMFRCTGHIGSGDVVRSETEEYMHFVKKQDATKVYQGEFSLKNLAYFNKCTSLCSEIEIYLENDLPLVVKYNVASLGELKLCVTQL